MHLHTPHLFYYLIKYKNNDIDLFFNAFDAYTKLYILELE